MEYVEHVSNLGTELRAPGYERGDRPFLDPHIEDGKLRFFYGQVADILLELSKPSFDRIGSLAGDCSSSTSTSRSAIIIKDRPSTLNMNEHVQLGNFPRSKLPSSTFDTASSYYQMLAEIQLVHLSTQRNDAVESEEDCGRKYVARQLFRRLASTSRLSNSNSNNSNTPDTDTGPPFKLFCDNLRPTNILLDENMRIVASSTGSTPMPHPQSSPTVRPGGCCWRCPRSGRGGSRTGLPPISRVLRRFWKCSGPARTLPSRTGR